MSCSMSFRVNLHSIICLNVKELEQGMSTNVKECQGMSTNTRPFSQTGQV